MPNLSALEEPSTEQLQDPPQAPVAADALGTRWSVQRTEDGQVNVVEEPIAPPATEEPAQTTPPTEPQQDNLPARLRTSLLTPEDRRAHSYALEHGIPFHQAAIELFGPKAQAVEVATQPSQEDTLAAEIANLEEQASAAFEAGETAQERHINRAIREREGKLIELRTMARAQQVSQQAVQQLEQNRTFEQAFNQSSDRAAEKFPQLVDPSHPFTQTFNEVWQGYIDSGDPLVSNPRGPELVAADLSTLPQFVGKVGAAPVAAPIVPGRAPSPFAAPRRATPLSPAVTHQPRVANQQETVAAIDRGEVTLETQMAMLRSAGQINPRFTITQPG